MRFVRTLVAVVLAGTAVILPVSDIAAKDANPIISMFAEEGIRAFDA